MGTFAISPSDLEIRRRRCSRTVGLLLEAGRETVLRCNVCGSERNAVIAFKDRYGIPIRSAICTGCGLVYLMDRLTLESYSDFYRDGTYRDLTSSFSGSPVNIGDLQHDQVKYAGGLIRFLEGRVTESRGARLLDVGGSSGAVALELVRRFGMHGTVLDPSAQEIAAAEKLGLRGVVGSAETWDTDERFDLITLCRTFEHLFDLKGTLLKIRRLLCPNGLFYCDFLDFMEVCRITGSPQTVAKVDHCYWTSLMTAPALFGALGFEIISVQAVPVPHFIGFLLRAAPAREPESLAWQDSERLIRTVQQIESDWIRTPGTRTRPLRRIKKGLRAVARVVMRAA